MCQSVRPSRAEADSLPRPPARSCFHATAGISLPRLTDAQRAELDYRIERREQNLSDVIPWEQVRASLFKKL